MKRVGTMLAAALTGLAAQAYAADKWDMPMAYPDSNFHTENGKAFAQCVSEGTGGELEIVVHGGGSLFKGNEIKRAVQTGQAPIGERLLSAHQNENALFGFDSIPVPGDRLRRLGQALAGRQADPGGGPGRAEPGAALCRALAAAGDLFQEGAEQRRRHERRQVPLVQHGHGADGRADGRRAGPDRGGRAQPGARHRRCRQLHLVGRHRLRSQGLGAARPLVRGQRLAAEELGVRQQGRLGAAWTRRPKACCATAPPRPSRPAPPSRGS